MGKRLYFSGKNSKLFFGWCSLIKRLKVKALIHENVPKFGLAELAENLDGYIWTRTVLEPKALGWPINRDRQLCIGVLQEWLYPHLSAAKIPSSPTAVASLLNVELAISEIFHRPFTYTWKDFQVHTPCGDGGGEGVGS